MKKTSLSSVLLFAFGLTMLSACGGGSSSAPQSQPQPTAADLTLSTAITGSIPVGTIITSYDVTIKLPAGVTVKTMLNSSETSTGVVTASGSAVGESIAGVYTAATGTFPGTVKVYVESANGFPAGEFCKVNTNIAAGYSPTAASFVLPTFILPPDGDGALGLDIITDPLKPSNVVLTGELSLAVTAVIR